MQKVYRPHNEGRGAVFAAVCQVRQYTAKIEWLAFEGKNKFFFFC